MLRFLKNHVHCWSASNLILNAVSFFLFQLNDTILFWKDILAWSGTIFVAFLDSFFENVLLRSRFIFAPFQAKRTGAKVKLHCWHVDELRASCSCLRGFSLDSVR